MIQAFAIVGALVFIVLACWVILIIMEAKDGEGLNYDWWDDEEKG